MVDMGEICVVCQGVLDDYHQAGCQMCGGRFHQPWKSDPDMPQCGQMASHEEALALVFLCTNCYRTLQEGE